MPETPNLFPGLTAEDRARLAAIAGNLETLPGLINRLLGYAADLSKARPQTPGLVTPVLPGNVVDNLQSKIDTPVPLLVDTSGRISVNTGRKVVASLPSILIPSGATVSQWYPVRPEMQNGTVCLSVDAPGRGAAEVISLEVAVVLSPDPAAASPDALLVTSSVHGATVGTMIGMAIAQLAACTFYRYKSAVAVASDLAFPLRALI